MTATTALAFLLATAVLVAGARLLWQALRLPSAQRPRPWRPAVLLLLQTGSAALLYLALVPPTRPVDAGTLVVLTAGADGVDVVREGARVVALPEAVAGAEAERVPDLATALRRFPGHGRLQVLGAGLVARDRDAVAGRALVHAAPPLPRGIVALAAPAEVPVGGSFGVGGTVHGVARGTVELVDPAGRRVDRIALGDDGSFQLAGRVGTAGEASFSIRIRTADGALVEAAALPLQVVAPQSQRLLLLGGAPGPELKYLRRWASDAGLSVRAQFSAGGGVQLGDRPLPIDAATLAGFDAVVLDERTLQGMADGAMAALRAQVDDGLGLVVRISGPLSAGGRARLASLGFSLQAAGLSSLVRPRTPDPVVPPSAADASGGGIGTGDAAAGSARDIDAAGGRDVAHVASWPGASDAATSPASEINADAIVRLPPLTRRPLRIVARDGVATLRAADGEALAVRRNLGRGRVAVSTVGDSFRWVLTGHGDRHARLWSDLIADTARAGGARAPSLPRDARVGTRATVCAVPTGATVETPSGGSVPLPVDPATGGSACAGVWPDAAGWHDVVADGSDWPFHVRDASALPGVTARELRQATARLAAGASHHAATATTVPGPRWPWWLAWLALSGLLWWLERARVGRAPATIDEGAGPGAPTRAAR